MSTTYNFTGYQNYGPIEEALNDVYKVVLGKRALSYQRAVGEAVCNAARYSIVGMYDAEIKVSLAITRNEIITTVSSKTKNFNALQYRKRLQLLAANPEIGPYSWGKYTGTSGASRGFWLMLQSCSRIVVDQNGDSIELAASINPIEAMSIDPDAKRKVNVLVPRFFVKNNGVIK